MNELTEINTGEIKVYFTRETKGKITLRDLGYNENDLALEGGFLRLVINFDNIGEPDFYQTPTFEFTYNKEVAETHWQCDYNDETLLDKLDHYGKSTVLLLNRTKLESLEQRHKNEIVVHAEFPNDVILNPDHTFIHLFK